MMAPAHDYVRADSNLLVRIPQRIPQRTPPHKWDGKTLHEFNLHHVEGHSCSRRYIPVKLGDEHSCLPFSVRDDGNRRR